MMTGEPDPLETKLRRLSPQPMSASLRGRIAERISRSARARARFLRGGLVGLAAVFLVSVSIIVAVHGPEPTEDVPATVDRAVSVATPGEEGEPRPLLTMRRLAEAGTPEEIDAILDQCGPRWLVFTQADRERLLIPDL